MEKTRRPKYPIGQQSFEQLRQGGYIYVDKSMYIEQLIEGSQYYFLSRPRRFGKSLFLSMLRFFFEGRRDLFMGLYADTMNWDWAEYPVLYLDLNNQQYRNSCDLDMLIEAFLSDLEEKYEVDNTGGNHSIRFARLIKQAKQKTGRSVVILVDEYDKPLVNNIHHRERFELYRDKLAALYSNFKSSADDIRMVFLTGVSRFGKLSVFSGLNNISDISFDSDYGAICGITRNELLANFKEGIEALAQEEESTFDAEVEKLKHWYDGYHFTAKSDDIYNPFSILNALAKRNYGNYWVASGTPTLLVELLKQTDTALEHLLHSHCTQAALEGLDIDSLNPISLFYQTGYLTIKDYNRQHDVYQLGLPNEEVKRGFFEFLLPYYAHLGTESRIFVVELYRELECGDVQSFMKRLTSFFAGISYEMRLDEERNVQNALMILFRLLGMQTDVEYHTSDGRIDILVRTDRYVYIIELKYNRSAQEALAQIHDKRYALPWATDDREVVCIGINYSSSLRGIEAWAEERVPAEDNQK